MEIMTERPQPSERSPRGGLRCVLGVKGLDDALGGGLPPYRMYLVKGDPGVGKTTLALQFLLEGARRGETGLYITLSETKEELETVAASHGWDLTPLNLFELSSIQDHLLGETDHTFFHPSEVQLNRITQALLSEIDRVNPVRVVFDSLSEMRLLAETSLRYRRQILQFKQFFAGRRVTVLFLDDCTTENNDLQIESIAHGVISLHRFTSDYGAARRQANIEKIRGVKFQEGRHDLIIETGGMVVFPRLVASGNHTPFVREAFVSGIAALDDMLGGGLDRGTSNMFMGAPGTGKSTLAIRYVLTAAERGEKSLMFIFDETVGILMNRAENLGMDLEPHLKSGLIDIRQIDPAEISPGEMADQICRSVSEGGTRIVVIDSINGYLNAMPAERFLNLQLHELLTFLNQQGVITIMVLAQQGLVGTMQSSVDLTYLADTVVLFRYYEDRGAVKQAMSIIKKRSGGRHERTIREMSVGRGGIHVGPPLSDMHGVLTGVPIFHGNSSMDEKSKIRE
jgi:circadian clock protein KaiC